MQNEPNTCPSLPLEHLAERVRSIRRDLDGVLWELSFLVAVSGVYDLATGELREEYQ